MFTSSHRNERWVASGLMILTEPEFGTCNAEGSATGVMQGTVQVEQVNNGYPMANGPSPGPGVQAMGDGGNPQTAQNQRTSPHFTESGLREMAYRVTDKLMQVGDQAKLNCCICSLCY